VPSIAQRGEWGRLLTAGLLHSGALAAAAAIDGVREAGAWVEAVCGGLTVAVVFATSASAAGLAQLVWGAADAYLSGAGVAAGAYGAWAALGLTRGRGLMPGTSDRGIFYVLAGAVLAASQPAVGLPCLAAGFAGGAAAMLAAPLLTRAVTLAFGVPFVLALVLLRVAVETARLLLGAAWVFAIATARAAVEVVKTIRGL
jgi:hypothetical protein